MVQTNQQSVAIVRNQSLATGLSNLTTDYASDEFMLNHNTGTVTSYNK